MDNRIGSLNPVVWFLPKVVRSSILFFVLITSQTVSTPDLHIGKSFADSPYKVFLPLISTPWRPNYRINAPYFTQNVKFEQTAILWFGDVNSTNNYADVRVGYNSDELYIHVAVVDRLLWYDNTHTKADLTKWDAVSVYLNLDGNAGDAPGPHTYRFDGQLNWWEPRDQYQAAYNGSGSTWIDASIPFTTTTGWRGYPAPNDMGDDRGWWIRYDIPFSSLGLTGPPSEGSLWGLAFVLHDRDDFAGTYIPNKIWRPGMNPDQPRTWGQLRFGLPVYSAPPGITQSDTFTIRNKLNGSNVADGTVGGSTTCGEGLNFWTEWGQKNYAGAEQVNVQNEFDISDWPCFSKFYLTFPLDSLPTDRQVVSATLTLYSIGNTGGGQWGPPSNSFIQILSVGDDWKESTLTWNNAPLAMENVVGSWVLPIETWPGWPGVPRVWNISYAVAEAYALRRPLRLVLYSADGNYNTGRYFSSSDVGDWDEIGRPTLKIVLGPPEVH